MDFSVSESLSYGQGKTLACVAKCVDLLNRYIKIQYKRCKYDKNRDPDSVEKCP